MLGDRRLWYAVAVLQLPAAAALSKLAPEAARPWVLPVVLAACVAVFAWWRGRARPTALDRLLASPWTTLALLLGLTAVIAVVYPLADGLRNVGEGSDHDDALVLAATRLAEGSWPYGVRTYLGMPITPGPGWLLLWLPLAAMHMVWLVGPLALAAWAWAMAKATGTWRASNVALVLLGTSAACWEHLVTGGDYLAIGALATTVVLMAHGRRLPWSLIAGLALVLGLVATSRVVFLYLPLAAAAALWPRDRRVASLVAGLGVAAALGLHAAFYLPNPEAYSPLWVLKKGGFLMAPWARVGCVLACLATGLWILRSIRAGTSGLGPCLGRFWPALAVPLAFVALGGLEYVDWGLASWKAARHLLVAAPPLAAALAIGDAA